jgi:vacuolar protein sorting-associated protein 13A/C
MVHPKAPTVISCKLHETDSPEFIYQLRGIYDTKNSLCRQYPIMKIQFGAPIKITNNLPFDFKWTMTDQNTNQCMSTVIKSGGFEQLHTFSSDGNLAFVMDIQNDGKLKMDERDACTTNLSPPLYRLRTYGTINHSSD